MKFLPAIEVAMIAALADHRKSVPEPAQQIGRPGSKRDHGRLGALAVATDLASALFVQMLRVHCERVSDAGTLRLLSSLPSARAVSAMLRAPGHDWTLDALAAEAHVSRASLVRIFRKTAGVAPLAFLTDLRLGLARQRLASTEASIARVAAEVGYQSESAFARAFHRRFKTTPGRIRASRIT